jgi:hypothetical protein
VNEIHTSPSQHLSDTAPLQPARRRAKAALRFSRTQLLGCLMLLAAILIVLLVRYLGVLKWTR